MELYIKFKLNNIENYNLDLKGLYFISTHHGYSIDKIIIKLMILQFVIRLK
uniref:Uncharacterized protein n=1 Tax=viral metagenome TaxID=1070528 RepID=A0A6C0J3J0_9ZZZZ